MATTAAEAKKTVIVAMVFTGGMAAAGSVIKKGTTKPTNLPPLRIYIGCVFAGFTLTLLADAAPELASAFALLIATGVLFTQYDVIKKIGSLLGGT